MIKLYRSIARGCVDNSVRGPGFHATMAPAPDAISPHHLILVSPEFVGPFVDPELYRLHVYFFWMDCKHK